MILLAKPVVAFVAGAGGLAAILSLVSKAHAASDGGESLAPGEPMPAPGKAAEPKKKKARIVKAPGKPPAPPKKKKKKKKVDAGPISDHAVAVKSDSKYSAAQLERFRAECKRHGGKLVGAEVCELSGGSRYSPGRTDALADLPVPKAAEKKKKKAAPKPAPKAAEPKKKKKKKKAAPKPVPKAAEPKKKKKADPKPEAKAAAKPAAVVTRKPSAAATDLYNYVVPIIRAGHASSLGDKTHPNATVKHAQAEMRNVTSDGIYGPKTMARGKELIGRPFPSRTSGGTVPAAAPAVKALPVSTTRTPERAAQELLAYVQAVKASGKDVAGKLGYKDHPNAVVKAAQSDMGGGISADGIYGPGTRTRGQALTGKNFPAR